MQDGHAAVMSLPAGPQGMFRTAGNVSVQQGGRGSEQGGGGDLYGLARSIVTVALSTDLTACCRVSTVQLR